MSRRYRTALVGVGRIGATYADDSLTQRHYRFASHAHVLSKHPAFAWEAAVDSDPVALAQARERWRFAHAAASMSDLLKRYEPEVLVLATPPTIRRSAIETCPGLRAVLCEKPLGVDAVDAWKTVELCTAREILMQINTWRRCDPLSRRLAEGELHSLIGHPQIVRGVYGNGLLNNGTHLIDFFRMLFGEIVGVQPLGPVLQSGKLGLADDFDVPCSLHFESGLISILQPLDFGSYREVGLDIWGDVGRLEILNEGLTNRFFRRVAHRAMSAAYEIAVETPEIIPATVGEALYYVYDNLAAALDHRAELLSSGASAWRTAVVVETIRNAALSGSNADQRVRYDRPFPATGLFQ